MDLTVHSIVVFLCNVKQKRVKNSKNMQICVMQSKKYMLIYVFKGKSCCKMCNYVL